MSAKAVMLVVLLVGFLAVHGTARPLNVFNVRGLLGVNRLSPDEVMTNNMRAQAASAQAIQEAVDSGASLYRTSRAGRVGSFMSWASASAAANPSSNAGQATFDMAERLAPLLP
jgi:hypothetical protein